VDKLDGLQPSIEAKGDEIFARIAGQKVSGFEGWSGRAVEWAIRDELFKTQLFRFVDVLPALNSPGEVVRHLREYFDTPHLRLAPVLHKLLQLAKTAPPLASWIVRRNVTAMANRFIAGRNAEDALPALRNRGQHGVNFTVDILGETVVSEREADDYALNYFHLIETLGREIPDPNISIKISALYSQIKSTAPEEAIEHLKIRLRPLLRRARELGVFVNFDMENYALKNLTLALFKSLLDESEFSTNRLGIVIQAYLRDSERDLDEFLNWARTGHGQFTIRLVKGAYWDYERVVARQRGWPVPVFESKAETDANYERLTRRMLQSHAIIRCAFGTHNVRSIAHAIVCAEAMGLSARDYEFQLLYGMAEPVVDALVQMGHAVREYAPIGELIPGMGYLVRRLLENTSNEGFLRAAFTAHTPAATLLNDPRDHIEEEPPTHFDLAPKLEFRNEPPLDFSVESNREKMRDALVKVRAQFAVRVPLLIDGEEITTAETMLSRNPAAPDEIVGHIAKATREEAECAVAVAKNAQQKWRDTPASERAFILQMAAQIMQRRRFELAALEIFEAGKPWAEADADVCEAIDFCNFYAAEMQRLSHTRETDDVPGEMNFAHYIPRGTGVVIAPWNFPLAILCGMTAAALVTGNCVIMKPAEQTSVIAYRLAEIFAQAGVPRGVLGFLPGIGEEIGEFLIHNPQVDFFAFTGSKEVGLKIHEAAGKKFAKAICEMGGKNAMIIDSDADLDEAVTSVITSAFGYAGQKCSALSRLIVLEENYDRFLSRLIDATRSLKVGPPENPEVTIGPIIDEAASKRVRGYVEIGKGEATLAFGGDSNKTQRGYFVPPVIFTDVPPDSRIAREEIFGPVLSIFKLASFEEALVLANDSEFALTAGLYSRSPANIERAKRELVAGNVYINRPITGALVKRQPFGGFKMSGTGTKAGGRDYLQHFMLPRVVTENVLRRGFAPDE